MKKLEINNSYKFLNFIYCVTLLLVISSFSHSHMVNEKSIIGRWSNKIVVPPSTEVYTNVITFSGEKTQGSFLDQNNHSGSWSIKGDSVTWIYENVPELKNTFTGKLSQDGQSMKGINFGVWQGEAFKGSWEATKL